MIRSFQQFRHRFSAGGSSSQYISSPIGKILPQFKYASRLVSRTRTIQRSTPKFGAKKVLVLIALRIRALSMVLVLEPSAVEFGTQTDGSRDSPYDASGEGFGLRSCLIVVLR